MKGAWLEGTLEGRVGLVPECWVEYLPALSDSDKRNYLSFYD